MTTEEREGGSVFAPKFDSAGLLTAVVVDHGSGDVLVVAHMNAEALEATLSSGTVHFWSRSRGQLWLKGETSGHFLHVTEVLVDCDQDALVLECVPSALAKRITDDVAIPTIGIGAGPGCDGQILVLHDLLGLNSGHRRPRFVKDFLAEGGSIEGALRAYADAVRDGSFPGPEHGYA